MSGPERAVAHVDLGAITRNCSHLASLLTDGARLCAVVKSNGYGHGAVESARAAQAGGAEWLAVATAPEAAELRRGGIDGRILVMGALTSADIDIALEADADVVAWERGFVEAVQARSTDARIHVKLDTGMGRLGTADRDEAKALLDLVGEPAGLMTHFATADEPGDDHFLRQLERFTAFVDEIGRDGLVVHAANSAATYRDAAAHFDMARCGVAIYGLDPFQEDPAERNLEPALSLRSYVAAVKLFKPGESAGYGRRWTAQRDTWVGTIPIGYGDGWRRALTNNAEVVIEGERHPLIGTVSMDNITVELGDATNGVRPRLLQAEATLIGAGILAEEVARRLGTINYEITCGLTSRVRRLHHE